MVNRFLTPSARRATRALCILWVLIAGALCAYQGLFGAEPDSPRIAVLAFIVLSAPPVLYWLFLMWISTRPDSVAGVPPEPETISAPRDDRSGSSGR